MLKPAFNPNKPFLSFKKTWARLYRLLQNPAPIRPEATPAHLKAALEPERKQKLPALNGKGSVAHAMEAIMQLFLDRWQNATQAINLAIYTTRTSLAKRIHKSDPKTAYRHILVLIEHGFLRGKVQVRGGLQLLLNPALLAFDQVAGQGQAQLAAGPAAAFPAPVAGITPAQAKANLLALAAHYNQNEKGRRPS